MPFYFQGFGGHFVFHFLRFSGATPRSLALSRTRRTTRPAHASPPPPPARLTPLPSLTPLRKTRLSASSENNAVSSRDAGRISAPAMRLWISCCHNHVPQRCSRLIQVLIPNMADEWVRFPVYRMRQRGTRMTTALGYRATDIYEPIYMYPFTYFTYRKYLCT